MERNPAKSRHFFKVMIPGFQQTLNLPLAFCKKLKEEKSEWAILKSCRGMWKIKICRNGGLMSFQDGWPQYAYHHNLSVGDFAVFQHIGELRFDVYVFDPTACEKYFVVGEHEEAAEAGQLSHHPKKTKREPEKKSFISYCSQNPYFIMTMKPYHAKKIGPVDIPAAFARSNDLGQKISVALRDPRGRVSLVKLLFRTISQFRLRMGTGWHDFYVLNEFKEGDVCVFDLNPSSLTSKTVTFVVQIFPASMRDIDTRKFIFVRNSFFIISSYQSTIPLLMPVAEN